MHQPKLEEEFTRILVQRQVELMNLPTAKTFILSLLDEIEKINRQVKILMAEKCGMPEVLINQYIGTDSTIEAANVLFALANDPTVPEEFRTIVRDRIIVGGIEDAS